MAFGGNMIWFVFIFVPLMLTVPPVRSQQTRLNTLTFKHYSVWATWQQAQSACREQHSDLTTIRNRTELQAYSGSKGWIGLYRKSDDGPWKWSSGEEIATFFNWETDNPKSGEHCVYQAKGKWNSGICDVLHTYMCYDEDLVLVKENKTWEEALEHCWSLKEGKRYDLATLITPDDHNYARERAKHATTEEVWTGLRYLGDEWVWSAGEPVRYPDTPGCPGRRCGVLEKNSDSLFGVRDCGQRKNFFCYKEPDDG